MLHPFYQEWMGLPSSTASILPRTDGQGNRVMTTWETERLRGNGLCVKKIAPPLVDLLPFRAH
jgi:hypothetical protein